MSRPAKLPATAAPTVVPDTLINRRLARTEVLDIPEGIPPGLGPGAVSFAPFDVLLDVGGLPLPPLVVVGPGVMESV